MASQEDDAHVAEKPKADPQDFFGSLMVGMTPEYATREILLGITICFAQIPESVAFAFMANIKPPIALHAAWMVGLICSVFGGRPGMVNGATGAFAAIVGTFIPNAGTGENGPGVELLFPSVMFAGFLMLLVSKFKLSRFITLLPAPVMIGFCNGLGIIIGLAQLHPFKDAKTHTWKTGPEMTWMIVICFASMGIMEFLPKLPFKVFKVIPSSLMAIIAAVLIEFAIVRPMGNRTDVIRDVSEFTSDTAIPIPFFVKTDYINYDLSNMGSFASMQKIFIQGFLLCLVGSIESLMTSEVVESFCKTPSDGDRTVLAMGVGNLLSGFFGGMGGNAMIGLSTVNCLNGGRGRLGPSVTALGIMICVMGAYPVLNYIPVACLAGIMLVVVLHTFKWFSLTMVAAAVLPASMRQKFDTKLDRKVPRLEVLVIVLVTLMCYFTNIAYAVGAGVAVCAVGFSWRSSQDFEWHISEEEGIKIYDIEGSLFFASSNRFCKVLDPDSNPEHVKVRFSPATSISDYSTLQALHKLAVEYHGKGKKITFQSLCPFSEKMIQKANQLVKTLEYTPREVVPHEVPGVAPLPGEAAPQRSPGRSEESFAVPAACDDQPDRLRQVANPQRGPGRLWARSLWACCGASMPVGSR